MNTNQKKRASMYTVRSSFVSQVIFFGILASVFGQATQPGGADQTGNLLSIKRVCVDKIAGDETLVAMVREIAIAGLFSSKRFTVTENCEKADAVLKGAVMERGERRVRGEGEATDFGVAAGAASVNRQGGSAGLGAVVGGSGETLFSSETRSQASVTLRIVDREGTVIWAHTQDSPGGKTKGAVPDAVERAIKQLIRDIEKAQQVPESPRK